MHLLIHLLTAGVLALVLLVSGCSPAAPSGAVPTPSPTPAPVLTPTPEPQVVEYQNQAFVSAALLEDWLPQEYEEFREDPTGYEVQVLFATDRQVTDFQLLALTPGQGEELTWDTRTLYTLDLFTPQKPLVVTTTFSGDLPDRGICYTDTDGQVRYFTLSLSGLDGTPQLEEFHP